MAMAAPLSTSLLTASFQQIQLQQTQHQPQQQQRCWVSSGRSRRGLYDGKDIRTGNNVSFSNKRTKRKFKPNVVKKRLYSETLDEMIRFHVTTSALRSIDKAGGLDNYLLTSRHVKEGEGMTAKKRILSRKKVIAKYGCYIPGIKSGETPPSGEEEGASAAAGITSATSSASITA
jgi:large subunit ribosomal protein L28